jgi:hypothetical protein
MRTPSAIVARFSGRARLRELACYFPPVSNHSRTLAESRMIASSTSARVRWLLWPWGDPGAVHHRNLHDRHGAA